jgi:hypothetical protein
LSELRANSGAEENSGLGLQQTADRAGRATSVPICGIDCHPNLIVKVMYLSLPRGSSSAATGRGARTFARESAGAAWIVAARRAGANEPDQQLRRHLGLGQA